MAAVQGREDSSALLGGHHSHLQGLLVWAWAVQAQKGPFERFKSIFGYKASGLENPRGRGILCPHANCSFFSAFADTCFLLRLIPASVESTPSPTSWGGEQGTRWLPQEFPISRQYISCKYTEPQGSWRQARFSEATSSGPKSAW